jgi:hypothetical protein
MRPLDHYCEARLDLQSRFGAAALGEFPREWSAGRASGGRERSPARRGLSIERPRGPIQAPAVPEQPANYIILGAQ